MALSIDITGLVFLFRAKYAENAPQRAAGLGWWPHGKAWTTSDAGKAVDALRGSVAAGIEVACISAAAAEKIKLYGGALDAELLALIDGAVERDGAWRAKAAKKAEKAAARDAKLNEAVDLVAVARKVLTADDRPVIGQALRHIARRCDHAIERDQVGFSASSVVLGHKLAKADHSYFNAHDMVVGLAICLGHQGQVGDLLGDLVAIDNRLRAAVKNAKKGV